MDSFPYDPSSIDEANLQIRINRNAGMRSLDYDIEDLKQRLQHQMAINSILAKEVNRYNLQRLNDLRASQAQHNQVMVLQTDYPPRMLNNTYSISGSSNPPTPRYAWNPIDSPPQLQLTPPYQSIQQRRTNNDIESIERNQHLETMSRSPKTDKGKMVSYDWSSQPILPKTPSETFSNYRDVNWAYNPLKNPEDLHSNKVDHFSLPCNHSRFSTSWIYDPSYQALGLDADPLQCVDILKEMRKNNVDGSSNNYINTTTFSTMAAATSTTNAISMSLPKQNQHHESNPLNVSHDTSADPMPPVSEEMVYNKNSIFDKVSRVDFADDYDFFSTNNMLNMEQFSRKKSKSNEWGF